MHTLYAYAHICTCIYTHTHTYIWFMNKFIFKELVIFVCYIKRKKNWYCHTLYYYQVIFMHFAQS